MKTSTWIILGGVAAVAIFAVARSDTSPRRMAEVEVNSCYRSLPSASDIFKAAERAHRAQQCAAMKEMYERKFNVKYTNY